LGTGDPRVGGPQVIGPGSRRKDRHAVAAPGQGMGLFVHTPGNVVSWRPGVGQTIAIAKGALTGTSNALSPGTHQAGAG